MGLLVVTSLFLIACRDTSSTPTTLSSAELRDRVRATVSAPDAVDTPSFMTLLPPTSDPQDVMPTRDAITAWFAQAIVDFSNEPPAPEDHAAIINALLYCAEVDPANAGKYLDRAWLQATAVTHHPSDAWSDYAPNIGLAATALADYASAPTTSSTLRQEAWQKLAAFKSRELLKYRLQAFAHGSLVDRIATLNTKESVMIRAVGLLAGEGEAETYQPLVDGAWVRDKSQFDQGACIDVAAEWIASLITALDEPWPAPVEAMDDRYARLIAVWGIDPFKLAELTEADIAAPTDRSAPALPTLFAYDTTSPLVSWVDMMLSLEMQIHGELAASIARAEGTDRVLPVFSELGVVDPASMDAYIVKAGRLQSPDAPAGTRFVDALISEGFALPSQER